MPLPHFTNLTSHGSQDMPDEIVYKNLYEVTIILPKAIQSVHPNATALLLENTLSIKFPTYPTIEAQEQRFKYSTRRYLKMPTSTSCEVGITFNMNQNDKYQVSTFRIMKDWYDLVWNNEDGSLHYKRNIIGDIVIHGHDKEGHVIRRVTYHNCQINTITGWEELSWDSPDMVGPLNAGFVCDYWEDYYY